MELEDILEKAVTLLTDQEVDFCVVGGFAVQRFRSIVRTTKDVDFAIAGRNASVQIATAIIKEFGYDVCIVREADLKGGPLFAIKNKSTPPQIVAAISGKVNRLDFLLPSIPWVEKAVERAAKNIVSFGSLKIPFAQAEDLLLAKIYALQNNQTRPHDLEDVRDIISTQRNIDLKYVAEQMRAHRIQLPMGARTTFPIELQKASQEIARQQKNMRGFTR